MKDPKRTASKATPAERPSTETPSRQGQWTASQKLAILAEYESYERGDTRRGELLRRVGAYTSHISKWRAQRDRGTLTSQKQPAVGRPALPRDPQQEEITRLQRENARLAAELDKAQFVISMQKKVATLLGMTPASLPNDDG
jgi:transposase